MPASLLTVTPLTASGIPHIFDNIPQPGVILWLDASKIAGISSGASLSAWTDSSASAAHATQASVASQPIYLSNVQNGLGVVSFNTDAKAFLTSSTSQTQPFSFGVALSSRRTNTTGQTLFDDGTGAFTGVFAPGNGVTGYQYVAGATLNASNVTNGQWVTITGVVSGSSTTLSVSGTTVFGNAGTNAGKVINIGSHSVSANPWNGQLGELIFYNRALTETDRATLESYLKAKWNTA